MSNFQLPFGQNQGPVQYNQFQQIQQMFPQPQGSVYSISTPTDIGSVPIGSTGLSVAICFPEQIMYIKSFQNGNPVIMAYRVLPYTKQEPAAEEIDKTSTKKDDFEERLLRLEEQINKLIENSGGKFNGLL